MTVFPEWEHSPLWTDGEPYRAGLRDVGVNDRLFEDFVAWGCAWEDLAGSDLGNIDDWSSVPEVQPWLEAGNELVGRLRAAVSPDVVVWYFDHAAALGKRMADPLERPSVRTVARLPRGAQAGHSRTCPVRA